MKVKYLILILLLLLSGCSNISFSDSTCEIVDDTTFIDSMGNKFIVDGSYKRIISLYSAHTENLCELGALDTLIGASPTSIYPPEASTLERYDYRGDPEPIIAANPDLVIIRPFIDRNYSQYVKAIKKAGIPVVSLYPENTEEFNTYIRILGMLVGQEEIAQEKLDQLDKRLTEISDLSSQIPDSQKKTVFFESTKTAYRTVTPDSNPAKAITIAGGINIAADVKPMTKGSTIAEFGIEKLLLNGESIDLYVSQRGAMNAGGSLISIPQREGFEGIKAVREMAILEINEKLISSPTLRYHKGVLEIARALYPEIFDEVTAFDKDTFITREDYAELVVKLSHTPIFVPSSSHYYEKDHRVHTYGLFEDVHYQDASFDYIETAVLNSFIRGYNHEGLEVFKPSNQVTRQDLAYTLYILLDIQSADVHITIKDLDTCSDTKIIQKIVDHNLMSLDQNQQFNPNEFVTGADVILCIENALKATY